MRVWSSAALLSVSAALAPFGCKSPPEELATPSPALARSALAALPSARPPRPISSDVVAFEKTVQAAKLVPPVRTGDCPLAFGKGVFGQLTKDALRVFDAADFRLLGTEPLEGPRALLALADGALLAVGVTTMLRWEPGKTRPTSLPRPTLMPGARLYADAQQADVLWVFDDGLTIGGAAPGIPCLMSYRLTRGDAPGQQTVLLPEQTLALTTPRSAVLGTTREGVWLFLTPPLPNVHGSGTLAGQVERFSSSGLRLRGFSIGHQPLPTWVLPARRLDQTFWVNEAGAVSRELVSPTYKYLSGVHLAGKVVAAASGNEGRVLAAVEVTGPGPRFELELLNQDLVLVSRAVLPGEEPTGADDWVRVVTENQAVVVAGREPRVAVGGPGRVTIFDAEGHQIFSISSK